MNTLKSVVVILVLVISIASWMPARVASSQAADPTVAAGTADSLNIEYVGHTGGEIKTVTLQGNYAYINEGRSMTILDISIPGSVAVVGRSPMFSSWVGGIAISGNYAYIANGDAGLRVMSVYNPSSLFEMSIVDTPGSVQDVAVVGDYAYIADWTDLTGGGLRVVNVAWPEFPHQEGFLETDMAEAVTLSGNYAFVVRGMHRPLLVVDVSDPTNPVGVGSYDPSAMSTAVAVVGDYAYLATFGSGMRVLDVSDPTNPTEVGIFNSTGSTVDITVQGGYAYLAEVNSPMGVRIVDISDPNNPLEVGFHTTPAWAYGVAVSGDFAYVASSTSGLRVVDVSDPTELVETDYFLAPGDTDGVNVTGDYAYLADGLNGLQVVNVSTPANPTVVGICDTEGYDSDVDVDGMYAYVADSDSSTGRGMHIVDVSDSTNPTEAGFFSTPGQVLDVAVVGGYAYVADLQNGLRVVDVSDSANPIEVGFLDAPALWAVTVDGDYAYLVYNRDLLVVDVSDPMQPNTVGSYSTGNDAYDVTVVGDYAIVANGEAGLTVVDVSNQTNPTGLGFIDTPGNALSVAVQGDFAYVADGDGGLRMIDISDPALPVEVGYYDTYAYGVSVADSLIYVAQTEAGLIILQYVAPPITTTTTILSDDPDPSWAGEQFTITFEVTSTIEVPSGLVTVTASGGGETCSAELVDGQGSCQIALSTPVSYTLNANYAGEGSFQPSSASESHTVEARRIHLPLLLQNQTQCADFFDDFSDPSSGWYTGETDTGRIEYLNGEYRVLVKPAEWYWVLPAPTCGQVNYTVEVDARWGGNSGTSYGLVFGIQGDYERYFSLEVNTDYREVALFRYDSSGWTELAHLSYMAMINSGAEANHLKVTRNGEAITLELNGTNLGTWTDSTITGVSYSGLIVSSYSDLDNADARFDNFRVTGLGVESNSLATSTNINQVPTCLPDFLAQDLDLSRRVYRPGKRR